MFRTAELGRKVSKEEFDRQAEPLRIELLELQQKLRAADVPVILVFAGVDGAGKSESMNLLNEWLDPRWIVTCAYGPPSDEERERPEFWRFWRDLPPKGRIGQFLSAWYSRPFRDFATGAIDEAAFDEELKRIQAFETTLADDGALILKFWMHLGKEAQKKRLKSLEKDPQQSWRVTAQDWKNWEMYDAFIRAAEHLIARTSVAAARWTIVEGQDHRYRALTVLCSVRDALLHHLERRRRQRQVQAEAAAWPGTPSGTGDAVLPDLVAGLPTVLDTLDMTRTLPKEDYRAALSKQQGRVAVLQRQAREQGISTVLVFEGWDAAGKGGAIRRLTRALDARQLQVIPVAAPTDEEQAQHYLWRFWRQLGRAGRVTVFDRSWYGRVLVERVEGYASQDEWARAFAEIRDFEEQIVQHGMVLCKFWLHITKDEQFARFKDREETPYKRWKLTEEDWRNRDKWDAYEQAINEMVERTSTHSAPWTLVEANDKRHARVKVIRTVAEAMERVMTKS
ncbi:polyphosphate:AMP phosphotransferase [Roseospira marina]|uniref:Polyphosphate:AMP phosphotransferase n=1 Tax=Roseospira marina TaxID=140057 RepID=A0A5M6IDW9_9PROT|nr:polyphosphate:AMP phosphotransferase [Roseospira marina]KAA5606481.1 polyphosphate:AMP phosphotransferase [Roseospira marina]MBB4314098.1 polyphosphate:AMP phosphotransferase [Roseospira marina]MBB5087259.1 polyphosphate:AMP phosphotransferase [Roseospira marina]